MNTASLRSKRLWIPTAAAVLALGVGGVVWASTASADLDGNERDRVGQAATQAVGGGEVIDAETSDDRGEAYEVEVRKADGTEVDVALDKDLAVVSQDRDDDANDREDDANDRDDDAGDRDDARERDDRALSDTERARAEQAAKAAVGGGTATEVEASDDRGEAYEVEVRKADGTEWDVKLDSRFDVVRKSIDN